MEEDGYTDVQAFMRTCREMESVAAQYNRDLAEWERRFSLISVILCLKQFFIHFSYIVLTYHKLCYPYNCKN